MASVTMRFGNRSMNCSLTEGENSAAVLDSETHVERSRAGLPGSSSASSSGRAIASPVIMIACTPSSEISSNTVLGSNWGRSTILLPTKLPPITPHCVAPCMSGAIGIITACAGLARPFSTIASGRSTRVFVTGSIPPPRAKKTSSWRHTTPFGMPVVPPV